MSPRHALPFTGLSKCTYCTAFRGIYLSQMVKKVLSNVTADAVELQCCKWRGASQFSCS